MVTNEEVYRRMNIKQSLQVDTVRRQMSFLGHALRKEEMEHLVVTGFVGGKRARGRQRETFLTYLGKFTNNYNIQYNICIAPYNTILYTLYLSNPI